MKTKKYLTEKERFEKLNKIIKSSIPLNNDVFMIFARNKKFCEEFLRVILEDKKLKVLENKIQKIIPSIANKNVVLDMLCKISGKKIVNVEIQLVKEKHHAKRIFTYASKIRSYEIEKGAKYGEVKDIIMIYLTIEDIFKLGSTVYKVEMNIVSDQKEIVDKWDAGLIVYYVNTKGLTNKNINEYLKMLTDTKTLNKNYKITNKIKTEIYSKGGVVMSKEMMEVLDDVRLEAKDEWLEVGIERGIAQGIEQGMLNILIKQYKDNIISAEAAAHYLKISADEFLKLVK